MLIFPKLDLYSICNKKQFHFRWLIFKIYSVNELKFETETFINSKMGIGASVILFYVRITISIPFPSKFVEWFDKKTSRNY